MSDQTSKFQRLRTYTGPTTSERRTFLKNYVLAQAGAIPEKCSGLGLALEAWKAWIELMREEDYE